MKARVLLVSVVLLLSWGCGHGGVDATDNATTPPEKTPEAEITATIGVDGGALQLANVALRIPPGALREDTVITIREGSAEVPEHIVARSPAFEFLPDGLSFDPPAEVEIAVAGGWGNASVFWSRDGMTDAYDRLDGRVEGGVITAQVTHFSHGLAGVEVAPEPQTTGDPCAGDHFLDEEVLAQVDDDPVLSERAFDASLPGKLCVILEPRVNSPALDVALDERGLVKCDPEDLCVCEDGHPSCDGPPSPNAPGTVVKAITRLLPGEHGLRTLLAHVPGSEVAIEARFARFGSQQQRGPSNILAVQTPVIFPEYFSPLSTEGGTTLTLVAEMLRAPGAQVSYRFAQRWEIVSAETFETVRVIGGEKHLEALSAGEETALMVSWDGRDEDSEVVADGTYLVQAKVELFKVTSSGVETPWGHVESAVRTITVDASLDVPPDMVFVPAGEFVHGWDEASLNTSWRGGLSGDPGENWDLGSIQYTESFLIDTFEVSHKRYKACVDEEVCSPPDVDSCAQDQIYIYHWYDASLEEHPVVCVTPEQAQQFCAYEGKRLPTDLEWEKAARGTHGQPYPWGDQPASCELAHMRAFHPCEHGFDCVSRRGIGCNTQKTVPVASLPEGRSPYGAFQMLGNVSEWALMDDGQVVLRGNSYFTSMDDLGDGPPVMRHSSPQSFYSATPYFFVGFRCVK